MWSWWDLKHEVAFNTGRKTSWLHRNKNRMPSTALNLPKILVSPKWFQMMVLGHWCCWHLWCLKSVFHHSLAKQSFSGSVLELGMMQFEPQNPPKSLYLPDMPTITPRLFLCPFCRMFALRRWQRRGAPGEMAPKLGRRGVLVTSSKVKKVLEEEDDRLQSQKEWDAKLHWDGFKSFGSVSFLTLSSTPHTLCFGRKLPSEIHLNVYG